MSLAAILIYCWKNLIASHLTFIAYHIIKCLLYYLSECYSLYLNLTCGLNDRYFHYDESILVGCDSVSEPITKQQGTQYPECETIPCSIPARRLMLSQTLIMSVNMPKQMEEASSLKTILAVYFKFWKIIRAKYAVNFFVLGCYMLHRLINLKWVHRILCTVDCSRHNCHAPCLIAFLGFQTKAPWTSQLTDWSFMAFLLLQMQPASLDNLWHL